MSQEDDASKSPSKTGLKEVLEWESDEEPDNESGQECHTSTPP